MICWFCHWGWHPEVKAIYKDARYRVGYVAMHFGPAHTVWEDENFDMAQWCLDNFDDSFCDKSTEDMEVVRWSLEELLKLPMEYKVEPEDYDGEHPENYPPPWR
jgi:hypothetical protein